MPFTFAHPAVVIPLLRCRQRWPWLSATGLVAGSIAPDFEKFFRLKLASHHSHTVASLFYFSCPVGLALAFLFHGLVRQPLLRHLPTFLHHRFSRWAAADWLAFVRRHPLGVLASIWLGAATHLLWDSFTHKNLFLTQYLPWLEHAVVLADHKVYVYFILTILSSAGGMLAIAWAGWRLPALPATRSPSTSVLGRYWGLAALIAIVLLSWWLPDTLPSRISSGIAAISAALLGVLVASAEWQLRYYLANRKSASFTTK
jgi:hypothetical protein